MYAIIRAGGKQYTVKPGDVLRVEKLDAELGAEVQMKDLLMVGGEKTFVGGDLSKALVTVVVTNHQRGPKLIIFKKKRRQGYRRTGGHRQPYTEIFVKSITSPEGTTAKAENQAQVYDPAKKAAKVAKLAEVRQGWKQKRRAAAKAGEPVTATPVKKASARKAAPKKAGAKKKAAPKKTGAKKAVKKTSKK